MTLHTVSNTIAIIIDGKKLMASLADVQKVELYDYFEESDYFISGRKIVFESTCDEIKYPMEVINAKPSNANHILRGDITIADMEELGKKILDLMHIPPFFNKQE